MRSKRQKKQPKVVQVAQPLLEPEIAVQIQQIDQTKKVQKELKEIENCRKAIKQKLEQLQMDKTKINEFEAFKKAQQERMGGVG